MGCVTTRTMDLATGHVGGRQQPYERALRRPYLIMAPRGGLLRQRAGLILRQTSTSVSAAPCGRRRCAPRAG